ncbi:unnamed protein product, partial [Sphenostylis stenocarpa]
RHRRGSSRAFDVESIKLKRLNAITNFRIKLYNVGAVLLGETDLEKVMFQNITGQGSLTMFCGTAGNVNGVGVEQIQMPMSVNTEEAKLVTLAFVKRDTGQGSTARKKVNICL